MFNKKLVISLTLFSLFMVFTSLIKTETRILEKEITKLQKKIAISENNIYESQLDYFYLTSPKYISDNIKNLSDLDYSSINYSKIYFSLNQFLNEQVKTTRTFQNEKKIQKK